MAPDVWAGRLTGAMQAAIGDLDYWLAQSPDDLEPLPVDHDAGPPLAGDQRTVELLLDRNRTEALIRRIRDETRPDHIITAAVGQAFARWSGRACVHLTVEGQGRDLSLVDGAGPHRSIGWFTALAPLLLKVPVARPAEVLRSVSRQLTDLPNEGASYGILRYLDPVRGPRLAAQPTPQVSVNYIGSTGSGYRTQGRAGAPLLCPAPEELPPLIHPRAASTRLWTVNATIRPAGLHVALTYAGRHYDESTAQRLANLIAEHLEELVDTWRDTAGQALAMARARAPRRHEPDGAGGR